MAKKNDIQNSLVNNNNNSLLTADGDDGILCPICDGDCTCSSPQQTLQQQQQESTLSPAMRSLKIKLTVPPSMRQRQTSSVANKGKGRDTTTRRRKRATTAPAAVARSVSSDEENVNLPFPTFLSASSLSSDTDSDDNANINANRERHRVRRELLDNTEDPSQRWEQQLKNANKWTIQRPPRRKNTPSVSDAEMSSSSGEEEEEEMEEEEEEEEPDELRTIRGDIPGVVTGWSDFEDEEQDADLFFANLSDSSASTARFFDQFSNGEETDDEDSSNAYGLGSLASLLDPMDQDDAFADLIGTEDPLAESVFDFEILMPTYEDGDASTDDEREEEEDNDGDVFFSDSDGETTEEEFLNDSAVLDMIHSNELSIDPRSTITAKQRQKLKVPAQEHDQFANAPESPSLQAVASARSSQPKQKGPSLGIFTSGTAVVRFVLINDSCKPAEIPSPFPRPCIGKRAASVTDLAARSILVKRPRETPPTDMKDAAVTVTTLTTGTAPSTPQASPMLMALDDVLDISSFVDDDEPVAETSNVDNEALKNLKRWDRIPMGTFRRQQDSANHADQSLLYDDSQGPMLVPPPAPQSKSPKKNSKGRKQRISYGFSPMLLPQQQKRQKNDKKTKRKHDHHPNRAPLLRVGSVPPLTL